MADNNEEGDRPGSSRNGNEWEVVSLTASAYATAPGPHADESIHEENTTANTTTTTGGSDAETSEALFLSGHFVFPPSEHENLPIEPEVVGVEKEADPAAGTTTEIFSEGGGRPEQKEGEKFWNVRGFGDQEEEYSSLYGDRGDRLSSVHGLEFDEAAALHGLNVAGVERGTYGGRDKFSSFHAEARTDVEDIYDNSTAPTLLPDTSDPNLDPSDRSHPLSDESDNRPEVSPGAWWKRQVASLRTHAKETNGLWSVFIAAAVMGLVILGQRWQQERWQVLQQRWHLSINAEKGRILGPLTRFKDIIVSSGQRALYTKNGIAAAVEN